MRKAMGQLQQDDGPEDFLSSRIRYQPEEDMMKKKLKDI